MILFTHIMKPRRLFQISNFTRPSLDAENDAYISVNIR